MPGGSASSGKHERRRIDGDHRRRSRTKMMAWRRCRASRGAWLGGEEEGVAAELLSSAEGRGVAGDGCYGERRRWVRRVRERAGGEARERGGRVRENRGGCGVVPGHPDEEGRGRQAGELVAWRGGARARRAHSPPSVEDEDDRGGRRAGPPAGWAGQLAGPEAPGKRPR